MRPVDYTLFRQVNGLTGNSAVDDLLILATKYLPVVLVAVVALTFLWGWRRHRERRRAGAVLATAAAGLALAVDQLLAAVVERQRPYVTHPAAHLLIARSPDPSFPSDHAAGAFALAAGVWLYDRAIGTVALVLAAVLAFSRVYVGTHYPLDVAAGAAIGIGAAGALHLIRPVRRLLEATATRTGRLRDRVPPRRSVARPRLLVPTALLAVALVMASRWGWVLPDAPAREHPVSIVTAQLPRHRAVIWAVGDGANGSPRARRVAARVAAGRPDLVLYLGDVYGGRGLLDLLERDGSLADFSQRYDPVYGRFAHRTAPTPGNHEWARRAQGYRPYWRAATGRTPSDFYELTVAGWQVLSLNSEGGHDGSSSQLRWLRSTLARHGGDCRLAFWHRPRFSAGRRHGDQDDVGPLWDAIAGRAALVVNGHEHDLQRFRPRSGTTQFVVGAGGKSRTPLQPDPRLAFGDDAHDGALRLTLTPGAADYAFVAADGSVLDAGHLPCTPHGGTSRVPDERLTNLPGARRTS